MGDTESLPTISNQFNVATLRYGNNELVPELKHKAEAMDNLAIISKAATPSRSSWHEKLGNVRKSEQWLEQSRIRQELEDSQKAEAVKKADEEAAKRAEEERRGEEIRLAAEAEAAKRAEEEAAKKAE